MKRLVLAVCLASSISGANAESLAHFIARGACPELAQIDAERPHLRGNVSALVANAQAFVDTAQACEWDAAHPKAK